ncbi:sensor histidine kinase [Dinghuibacter silviterrae]|uniref:histidine kinase n=1 Tax=Dinghuibacter silviterrae TaxID=1539049 RepID=A0A4R8DGI6_9BACT|nr:ATP-binding protein [Dinghuibacter silviterrae]TDW96226.1 signal transduction histidine kinase [Dinghuibacter silviterrae]
MRLLQKTIRSYIAYSVVVLLVAIPVFYFSIKSLVSEDADEHLQTIEASVRQKIVQAVQTRTLTQLAFADQDVTLSPGNGSLAFDTLTDEDIYDSVVHEHVPYRVLTSQFMVGGTPYLLRIRSSMLDSQDLIENIVYVQVVLLLILLCGLLLINRRLSKRLWKPFYSTLERLRQYAVEQGESLPLAPTEVIEFRDLNRSLKELTLRAHAAYKAQKEFTENAAHEVQTPLAVLQSKLELLMQTRPLTEEQAGLIGDLANAIQRLSRLNKSLVLLTRIENHQIKDTELILVGGILEKSLANLQGPAGGHQIDVTKDIQGDPVVEANRSLLEVLVGNLLSNAFRHNKAQGAIYITLTKNQLKVRNTGRPAALDPQRIFQRFYKESQDRNSIGLGLQIVFQIAAFYGWALEYGYQEGLHTFIISFA